MSRWFSSIQLVTIATISSMLAFSLSGCSDITNDEDRYTLSVTARGLAENEAITVFNGSSVRIIGTEHLSWTEPQRFTRRYNESRPDYVIQITRQPSSSNKTCRVLNPRGVASKINTMIRIECGFPVVIADVNDTMTDDNGFVISNGLQALSINRKTKIITSLYHELVQDPLSDNPDDKTLQVVPERNSGNAFEELYLEGNSVSLTLSSAQQGCEITGADDNSAYHFMIPSADTFIDTVQTIPLNKDWIDNSSKFGDGRTCNAFNADTVYQILYASSEKTKGTNNYTANCYPMDPVEVNCGYALKVKVRGLNESLGEFITLTANRNGTTTHTLDFSTNFTSSSKNRGIQTFNLAFENGDTYFIELENENDIAPKTCTFDNSGINQISGVISGNITEILICN